MKQALKYSLALCLLYLCVSPVAADIEHVFQDKYTPPITMETVGSTVRSTNDGVVYTLSGKAKFFWDYLHPKGDGGVICLNFTQNGDNVVVSPAFSNLSKVTINYMIDKDEDLEKYISVYLSTDGSTWNSVTPTLSISSTRIVVTPPSTGTYYVKIACTKNASISISQISYSIIDCNCFPYTAE